VHQGLACTPSCFSRCTTRTGNFLCISWSVKAIFTENRIATSNPCFFWASMLPDRHARNQSVCHRLGGIVQISVSPMDARGHPTRSIVQKRWQHWEQAALPHAGGRKCPKSSGDQDIAGARSEKQPVHKKNATNIKLVAPYIMITVSRAGVERSGGGLGRFACPPPATMAYNRAI